MYIRIVAPEIVQEETREYLKSLGTAKMAARITGVSAAQIYKLYDGRRRAPRWLLNVLNMRRIKVFYTKNGEQLTENQARQRLRDMVMVFGALRFARELGIKYQFIYDIMKGKELLSERVAEAIGLVREEVVIRMRRPKPKAGVKTQPIWYRSPNPHPVCY